ncbi:glycosyltransferase family 39 protein [bacterium SCSIO 12741]|nr:glycosyltransferase family 39 protein [bacterium SCSIO 12741]
MDHYIIDSLVIILCLGGYFWSWKLYRQNRFRPAVFLLSLCALLIYCFVASDLYLHTWDERFHALVAKNLMSHPWVPTLYDNPALPSQERSWVSSHIWLHKQPIPLWLMAGSMKLFGVHEFAVRLPSVLMSTLGVGLIFSIGKYLYHEKVGFIAAFLFSINGLILELTGGRIATDHIDVHFLFFVLLAVFLTVRFIQKGHWSYSIFMGLSIGAAILTKWLPALIVLPIWLLLVADSKRFSRNQMALNFGLILLTTVVVALPWQVYINQEFPVQAAYEAEFNYRHFTEELDGRGAPFYYFLNQIRINYGELIYLPLLWFLWKMIKSPQNYRRMALLLWFVIPLLVFSMAKTKMQGYLVFTAPALFLITAEFYGWVQENREKFTYPWVAQLLLFLFIFLPARYGVERMKPFDDRIKNPQWAIELRSLGKEPIEKGVLLNYERNIEAMFYTNLTVYSHLPNRAEIEDLVHRGYRVIIHDEGIPDDIKSMDQVEFRSFHLSP